MAGLCDHEPKRTESNMHRVIRGAIYAFSGAIGVLAFAYPFFTVSRPGGSLGLAHSRDAPLIAMALVGVSLIALLVELQGGTLGAKMVALLGVLVAIASVLRFVEVVLPMPGGFSPIFAPIILSGYVFGGRFGFLVGVFTMLVSGLITGGVGPWLPYQMFTAGWAGMTAGWLGRISESASQRVSILILCAFGFVWGLLYGVIINIYFWPFAVGTAEQTWSPGIGLRETLARYATFYLATSLPWDLARAVGNVALILLLGAPVVRALARFQRRFHFEVHATDA